MPPAQLRRPQRPEEYHEILNNLNLEEQEFSIGHEYVFGLRTTYSFLEAVKNAGDLMDVPDRKGKTPLHWAALFSNTEAVELLLRLGANPSIHDFGNGNTPLHYAVQQLTGGCTKLLLEHGASPHTRNAQQWTPLHGCTTYRQGPLEAGNVESATHLLGWGARPEDRDEDGQDALIKAVRQDMPKLVTLLLDVGKATVDTVDNNGVSAVAFGIRQHSCKALPFLLHKNPNLNSYDFEGNSILHEAAACANVDIVIILREARIFGPYTDQTNRDGLTPMSIAQKSDSKEFIRQFSDLLLEVRVRNLAFPSGNG